MSKRLFTAMKVASMTLATFAIFVAPLAAASVQLSPLISQDQSVASSGSAVASPVSFRSISPGWGGYYYGAPGQIVPAPGIVSPPVYVPTMQAMPIAPPVMRIFMTPQGPRWEIDPDFYLYYMPRYPNFLTNGAAVYQLPYPYPYSPLYPGYGVPPPM